MSLPNINDGVQVVGSTHLHKVLYHGTKSFWRTRETVDVHIIEHSDMNTIEIVGFSVEKYEEADRIFCDMTKLYQKCETAELLEKVAAKREEYSRARKRVPNEEITSSLCREAAVQYILTRLVTAVTTTVKEESKARRARLVSSKAADVSVKEEEDGEGATESEATAISASASTSETTATTTATATATTTIDSAAVTTGTAAAADTNTNTNTDTDTGLEDSTQKPPHLAQKTPSIPAHETGPERFAVGMAILTGDKAVSHPFDKRVGKILDVLYALEPEGLEHVQITRARKKASNKEFNAALRGLKHDSERLNKACSDAQRKAGLAVSSVDGFRSFARSMKYDPETMSLPQWRWIWAGRRVILQNFVAAVTKRLEEIDARANGSDGSGEGAGASKSMPGGVDVPMIQSRRKRESASTSKLPSLSSRHSRHSMGSRRLSRGSREPRPIDDFSAVMSEKMKQHADARRSMTSLVAELPQL